MQIDPIEAFSDNYIWWLSHDGEAAVVDPGDAGPVLARLSAEQCKLTAILVTHHHPDHVGGVAALVEATGARVYGPAHEHIPCRDVALHEGARFDLLATQFAVLDVPGHTAGHIAYYCGQLAPPALFCGDTLFAAGCGRLFEGTPEQMLASLDKLAALPPATRVYCAHEYTLANLRFAAAAEPGNPAVAQRTAHAAALRHAGQPTVPSTVAEERLTNPFLRSGEHALRASAAQRDARAATDRVASFAALRAWKDGFRG
jgi:hydroxyacylglutathione hydrolase